MRVQYIGGDAGGREVPALGDRHFAPNDPQDVPDDIGASLCQQVGVWEEVKATPTPKDGK